MNPKETVEIMTKTKQKNVFEEIETLKESRRRTKIRERVRDSLSNRQIIFTDGLFSLPLLPTIQTPLNRNVRVRGEAPVHKGILTRHPVFLSL